MSTAGWTYVEVRDLEGCCSQSYPTNQEVAHGSSSDPHHRIPHRSHLVENEESRWEIVRENSLSPGGHQMAAKDQQMPFDRYPSENPGLTDEETVIEKPPDHAEGRTWETNSSGMTKAIERPRNIRDDQQNQMIVQSTTSFGIEEIVIEDEQRTSQRWNIEPQQ